MNANKPVKVLIVDDEPLARARLTRLLDSSEQFAVVAEADNGARAIDAFNHNRPDIVLLDIRMPEMDGLQAARHLATDEHPPAVIFCTAYGEYALEAFEANAVDYLLKPVNRDKLLEALARAQRLNRAQLGALESTGAIGEHSERAHISARTSRGIELIPLADVRYFLADQKYVTVYYRDGERLREVLIDEPLKDLEQGFPQRFLRVHRNALVAIEHIQGLERGSEGTSVRLADVAEGPLVSRRHLPEVRKLLKNL